MDTNTHSNFDALSGSCLCKGYAPYMNDRGLRRPPYQPQFMMNLNTKAYSQSQLIGLILLTILVTPLNKPIQAQVTVPNVSVPNPAANIPSVSVPNPAANIPSVSVPNPAANIPNVSVPNTTGNVPNIFILNPTDNVVNISVPDRTNLIPVNLTEIEAVRDNRDNLRNNLIPVDLTEIEAVGNNLIPVDLTEIEAVRDNRDNLRNNLLPANFADLEAARIDRTQLLPEIPDEFVVIGDDTLPAFLSVINTDPTDPTIGGGTTVTTGVGTPSPGTSTPIPAAGVGSPVSTINFTFPFTPGLTSTSPPTIDFFNINVGAGDEPLVRGFTVTLD